MAVMTNVSNGFQKENHDTTSEIVGVLFLLFVFVVVSYLILKLSHIGL